MLETKGQAQDVHLNDDQNRQRRFCEIWCPKTIIKYPSRVLEAVQAIFMQLRNTLKIIKWEPEQAMEIITGKNGVAAGRKFGAK